LAFVPDRVPQFASGEPHHLPERAALTRISLQPAVQNVRNPRTPRGGSPGEISSLIGNLSTAGRDRGAVPCGEPRHGRCRVVSVMSVVVAADNPSPRPVILAVDDDPEALSRIADALTRRFGADYRIVCAGSGEDALAALDDLQAERAEVAVVLADQWLPGTTGTDLLTHVGNVHPEAKRGLLIRWGDWAHRSTADAVLRAMALGRTDCYVLKPWHPPDELFHRTVAELVHEWSRGRPSGGGPITVVGERHSPRTSEVRGLLTRNGIPHAFHLADTGEGRAITESLPPGAGLPVIVGLDGHAVANPTNEQVAEACGLPTQLARSDFDLVIVGAGPAGLATAVYAGSEGLRTLVVERETIGGQAGSSSLIRNYLGFARGVSGAELTMRAYQQAWLFGVDFLMMREVALLRAVGGGFRVSLSGDDEVTARAVVVATGVAYRRLGIPELEALSGAGVFYGASVAEAPALAGERVYVVGGGNSAGQAARYLSRHARQVTVLVRGDSLAQSMSRYLIDEIEAAPNIDVSFGTEVVGGGGEGRLEQLVLADRGTGARRTVEAAALFVLVGAQPHTGWLPDSVARDRWGFVLTGADLAGGEADPRWPLTRPPSTLESSLPGCFAVGDVRHGSVKRVASAVGDGAVVVAQVHEHLNREIAGVGAIAPPGVEGR
jgi:thioredoxin reductase (NADPH)